MGPLRARHRGHEGATRDDTVLPANRKGKGDCEGDRGGWEELGAEDVEAGRHDARDVEDFIGICEDLGTREG